LFEAFFLFICEVKRKKASQRKKKHASFLCPLGIQFKWLLRASPHSLASQTRAMHSNNARLNPERVA